eukprot:1652953-Amphidinium_carterae.1
MPFYLASVVLLLVQDLRMGADAFWRDLVIAAVLGMVIKLLAVACDMMSAEWNSILGKCCHHEDDCQNLDFDKHFQMLVGNQ